MLFKGTMSVVTDLNLLGAEINNMDFMSVFLPVLILGVVIVAVLVVVATVASAVSAAAVEDDEEDE